MTNYENLESRFRQLARLQHANAILGWDEAVMMPSGSSQMRNETMAELAGLIQNLAIAPEVGSWLKQVGSDGLSSWQVANLRAIRKNYLENTAIPTELNQKLILARMNCEQKWRHLRAQNDWKSFSPCLEEVLKLTREAYQALSQALGLSVYDAALSLYSPGLTTAVVESLFSEIKTFLPGLIQKVVERQKTQAALIPQGKFDLAAQKALGRELMTTIGFSFEIGRLDESHHPFCGGTARDVRITTRYSEEDFYPAMMGILHETGHALYEQHLPSDWLDQPVGAAAGMAIHESQSLLMEMQICRSPEFLQLVAPILHRHLGAYVEDTDSLSAQNLALLATRVQPGYIRVDADEVTYPAHVILRFELEKALLEGQLSVSDLPEAWNEKMQSYLGLSTKGNYKDGCMQDVHWPAGLFGYFPAYTFGAVIAAQLFAKLLEKHPQARHEIARGQFQNVHQWLNENIWSQGSRLTTLDLVEAASGPLSAKAFRRHLETRYL